jgi:ribonuclease III
MIPGLKYFKKFFGILFKRGAGRDKDLERLLEKRLRELEKNLGFNFINRSYYLKALAHRSALELYPQLRKSNERLEFLGDSILGMVVANYLFHNFPGEEEGFLTKSRAALVNKEVLASAAESIGLDKIILFNQRYLHDTEGGVHTIIADGFEALIGAIYLDKGIDQAAKFIRDCILKPAEEDESYLIDTNYKGQLLEYSHAHRLPGPRYLLIQEVGPPHKKEFTIEVIIGDKSYGTAVGKSKKGAEQEASRIALQIIKDQTRS